MKSSLTSAIEAPALGGAFRSASLECHRSAVRTRLSRSEHVQAGPGSISWTLNREIVVVAGWGRAILLQLAHPSVAAGVHQHSTFRGSLRASLRRLHATVGAMLSITFGDTEAMITAAAGINAIHDRVRGRVPASPPHQPAGGDGVVYSAHDPALQQWVHATLLDSIPLVYERLVGPLAPSDRDRYCAEALIMEPLLGIPPGRLPRHATELDTYMREMLASGTLVVTDTSRALARALLYPPNWHLMWPAFRVMQLLTIESLPSSIRDAYGFSWTPRDARALARWTMLIRVVRRLLPPLAREWPIARTYTEGVTRG